MSKALDKILSKAWLGYYWDDETVCQARTELAQLRADLKEANEDAERLAEMLEMARIEGYYEIDYESQVKFRAALAAHEARKNNDYPAEEKR